MASKSVKAALACGARQSSSVVVLRHSIQSSSFEVLMAKRSSKLKSFSSAYVFPGGVEDNWDTEYLGNRHYLAKDKFQSNRSASKVSAARELFEETGILIANNNTNVFNQMKDNNLQGLKSREDTFMAQLSTQKQARQFGTILNDLKVDIDLDNMRYMTTFITPVLEKRRFITDFFVSFVGPNTTAMATDDEESVEFCWINPNEALLRNAKGNMKFLPPQYLILSLIDQANRCAQDTIKTKKSNIIKAIDSIASHPPILPHPVMMEKEKKLLTLSFPGDAKHCEYNGTENCIRRIECKLPLGSNGFKFHQNQNALDYLNALHNSKL